MDKKVKEEEKIEKEVSGLISENRVIGFSDAVFAFAATLLVLKIDLPTIAPGNFSNDFVHALTSLWPQYLANIISFLVIGYYWLNHHAIFGLVKTYNSTIVWINIIFLIFLSFLPFPVDLYGDYFTTPIVVVFYSASLALVGYILALIWWYASASHRLINPELSNKSINYYLVRILVAPVVFTLSIPLVYIHPAIAQISWLFILVATIAVNRAFKMKKVSEIEKNSL